MKRVSLWRRIYLKHFAKPASERVLYSAIASQSVRQIVEIGVGNAARSFRLIQLAVSCQDRPISYCGLDMFEAAPKGRSSIRIKDAYCKLNVAGCKTKLVPGEPTGALASCANALANTDMVLISNQYDSSDLAPMWMYIPRMLAPRAQVWMEQSNGEFQLLPPEKIRELSEMAAELRRKSA